MLVGKYNIESHASTLDDFKVFHSSRKRNIKVTSLHGFNYKIKGQ